MNSSLDIFKLFEYIQIILIGMDFVFDSTAIQVIDSISLLDGFEHLIIIGRSLMIVHIIKINLFVVDYNKKNDTCIVG